MTKPLSLLIAIGLLTGPAMASNDIIWARYGDIDSLDPHRTTSTLSMQVWNQIYEPLLARDAEGNIGPNLAKDYRVSDDGTQVTFVLHEGIQCHDGSEFTAEDVIYTYQRAFSETNPSNTQSAWGPIESVNAVDAQTVSFSFSEPFGAFIPFMADPFASMICKSNEQSLASFGSTTAIGTGAWQLVQWIKGDRIELARNEAYVNHGRMAGNAGPAKMDKLIIKVMPEAQARLAALQTGEVHIAEPPLESVSVVENHPHLNLLSAPNTGQNVFIEFAVSRPPFNDVRARQAVAYAIDPDMALDIVFEGLVEREHCTVARGVMGNDQDYCKRIGYQYDPAKAKQLLAELGYDKRNPMDVKIMTWTDGSRDKLLQVFQSQLKQVGIEVSIEIMDIGSLNARVKQENHITEGKGSMDLMGWSWYDPDILYQLWHSPGAYDGYNSPELDALLKQTRLETNPEKRLEIVQQVQAYLIEQAVHVPIYTPGWVWLYGVNDSVSGLKFEPFNQPIFTDVVVN
ncbi:ABC transporter substrate-binding protein [Aliagarivorans marinus]|uniref:ABC transporter substrate-binding protein n=1 Tax=Aliagarivorans marinus TaxID=561965 RepID=UPI000427022E|nr:ABC transporter substrate-binding protein [Aliagarivorans marinus]